MTSSRLNGPSAAIHSLFIDHQSWLVAWLRKRLGDACDAADLSQDTWTRMISSGRLPLAQDARAYLRQIANGLAIDLHRRRVLEREYLNALTLFADAVAPSAQEQAMVVETLRLLDQLLGQMPAKAREVFLLSRLEGLTYSEIALTMHMSVANVRKCMLKAIMVCSGAQPSDCAAGPHA